MKAILEIYRTDDETTGAPWATTLVPDADYVPSEGEMVLFRSAEVGSHEAVAVKVQSLTPLSTLDGFRVVFRLNTEKEGPHYLWERAFRRDLLALGLDRRRCSSPPPRAGPGLVRRSRQVLARRSTRTRAPPGDYTTARLSRERRFASRSLTATRRESPCYPSNTSALAKAASSGSSSTRSGGQSSSITRSGDGIGSEPKSASTV